MQEKYTSSSSFAFGSPDQTSQLYRGKFQSVQDIFRLVPTKLNPLSNWSSSSTKGQIPTPTADNVSSWFRKDDQVAFRNGISACDDCISYEQLHQHIEGFVPYETRYLGVTEVGVVALLLPTCLMMECAITITTLLSQHVHGVALAPLDPTVADPKLISALKQLQCSGIVTTKELFQKLQVLDTEFCLGLADIRFIGGDSEVPRWDVEKRQAMPPCEIVKKKALRAAHFSAHKWEERPALLLRTSGTTATPKIVPITASSLLFNAGCIAVSLELKHSDIGCNAMPLFHIGGIACALLAVLISGSSVIMLRGPFESNAFLDTLLCKDDEKQPTWYYGVPSMHKALLLTAQARIATDPRNFRSKLRFIRSGAAHLPHGTARELAEVFRTKVIPTYSMSECMPVCSAHDFPISASTEPRETCGLPIGPSVAILDENGHVLPHGSIGEVCLMGPGVINEYVGLSKNESHYTETSSGSWFRTGDMGTMSRDGQVTLSGRSKEMIKRGGEQVWPNEVDAAIESIPKVQLAVSFGVPNELWGEEVQVAVVLQESSKHENTSVLAHDIGSVVQSLVGTSAKPSNVIFVDSVDDLIRGSTGKYLRTSMASHLGAKPVDTCALGVLTSMVSSAATNLPCAEEEANETSTPSAALNGVRFLTACFVVHIHAGLMPSNAWTRVQAFSVNMSIFFILGAFQLAASTKCEVISKIALFIGTKIGSMQAFFIVAHLIAIGAYLMLMCGPTGYQEVFEDASCTEELPIYLPMAFLTMATGFGFDPNSNGPAWFQSVFYQYLIVFPLLDRHLRNRSDNYLKFVFVLNMIIASTPIIWIDRFPGLNYSVLSWLPVMVCSMIAGYAFTKHGPREQLEGNGPTPILQRPRLWGILVDAVSLIFVLVEVLVVLSPNCAFVGVEDFETLRPEEDIPELEYEYEGVSYVEMCDVSHEEFVEYVWFEDARLDTVWSSLLGWGRLATPLVFIWLFGLAYGHGWTARLFSMSAMQALAPFAYPLYLLHVPVLSFYWVATRGHEAKEWWSGVSAIPVPIEWWEVFLVIAICLAVAWMLDYCIVRHMLPYTIQFYVRAYQWMLRKFCCCWMLPAEALTYGNGNSISSQLQEMMQGLTGVAHVSRSTNLRSLGLDSLGTTALLGALRASVPAAKALTLRDLLDCETVGDLEDHLAQIERI